MLGGGHKGGSALEAERQGVDEPVIGERRRRRRAPERFGPKLEVLDGREVPI
jgi:hypothetical protein